MAQRLNPGQAPAAPASGDTEAGAVELEILHPERRLKLAGREITVREYGHIEGLRLLGWAKPFCDDLYALAAAGSQAPELGAVAELLARHADLVRDMVAQATDVEPAWVESLGDQQGDLLVMSWWRVNAGFFIRRLLARAAGERIAASRSTGGTFTTH